MASERDWKSDWLMVGYPGERKREVRALWGMAGAMTLDRAAAEFREEEHVARAMYETAAHPTGDALTFGEATPEVREWVMIHARAAIAAVREREGAVFAGERLAYCTRIASLRQTVIDAREWIAEQTGSRSMVAQLDGALSGSTPPDPAEAVREREGAASPACPVDACPYEGPCDQAEATGHCPYRDGEPAPDHAEAMRAKYDDAINDAALKYLEGRRGALKGKAVALMDGLAPVLTAICLILFIIFVLYLVGFR